MEQIVKQNTENNQRSQLDKSHRQNKNSISHIFFNSIQPSNPLEVRVTPAHSPIQGGGDLCLVFSQQDHPVPQGEKFLHFDSIIAPHLVAINQDMGYALFTQIPAHPRSETLQIYVMLAETRAKIASAEFTYTDSSYSPYTIEVLKGLTQNLITNEHYKSITADFSSNQFHNTQQQTPNQFYNHSGYNPIYKMLVLAAGLGLEPLLYVLLQPRTHHNLLLMPSPAGLLPEDYAHRFGHHRISVCLALVRKQYEHTSGVQNDETEDGEVETTKRDNKSSFYPKGDPLELINRGGTTPKETTQAIMAYLTKLMTPTQVQLQPIPSPPAIVSTSSPADKKTITKACSEDVLTKKSSVGKQEPENEPSPKPYDRGHSTPKLGSSSSKSSSSNVLGDSGYEPSFESFRESRDGDVITGEINLISGLKYTRKCDLGSINSINHHKVDRMLEKDAIDLLNQELKGLRMEGRPMVLTARGEFEATLKLEPLQSTQDLQKVFDSREVKITKSDESSFAIVGGDQTGIFIHSTKNTTQNQRAPGGQILAVSVTPPGDYW
ncbi:hypothetical protein LOD99_8718 [Oopsacas minuta]|uniref:Uncharacterized protein n=1 Tax=Oopsacas minuta TaxID=111878 RepID=A0AAV7JFU8_9METZ|nr:hypothetical protein LOD99_8718 [Oopsacas minuta]